MDVCEYLREELDRAHVLPAEKLRPDIVSLGSQVEFRDEQTGKIQEIILVYPLDADIARHSLGKRIAVPGAVSPQRLAALYAEADAFVLASHFEGYGMAYAEAVAHGLPVIGTSAGAIPETVPRDAGLLVDPGDIPALAQAMRRVIGDADLRRDLANAARAAAPGLPAWRHSAEIFARAVEALK